MQRNITFPSNTSWTDRCVSLCRRPDGKLLKLSLFTVHDFASKIWIWFLIAAGTFTRGAKWKSITSHSHDSHSQQGTVFNSNQTQVWAKSWHKYTRKPSRGSGWSFRVIALFVIVQIASLLKTADECIETFRRFNLVQLPSRIALYVCKSWTLYRADACVALTDITAPTRN